MQEWLEQRISEPSGPRRTRRWARPCLVAMVVACVGVAWAQIPSGDPPPFIDAEIEVEAGVDLPGVGGSTVKGKVNVNTDGLGAVLDAVIGALCRILPCSGDDEAQTQALARATESRIGDERTGVILESGSVPVADLFGGIVAEERTYEFGFFARFAPDARVQVRSLTFVRDAFLTEAYLRDLGLEGPHYVPQGTYYVLDRKLTIPVLRQR